MGHETPQFPEGKKISPSLEVIEESALIFTTDLGERLQNINGKHHFPLSRWDLKDKLCIDASQDRDKNWEDIRAQRGAFAKALTRYSMLFRETPKEPTFETQQKWMDEELGLIAYTAIIRYDFMLAIADITYVEEPEAGVFVPKQSRPQLWIGSTAAVKSFLDEHPYVPAEAED